MSEAPSRRRPTLYGRRKGPKLSLHQQKLRDELLPRLTLKLDMLGSPHASFGAPVEDVWLEIGFGGGEHLLALAKAHPGVGLMGAEPYEAGVAKLLSKLEGESEDVVARIRIHEGDARELIAGLPEGSLGAVFILFPDPWPKTRHHKRRFVQMDMLDQLARVMRSGAELRFASDDTGYFAWTLERLTAHPKFSWTARRCSDWMTRPAGWPPTRYENKALHGPPGYLQFRRCED